MTQKTFIACLVWIASVGATAAQAQQRIPTAEQTVIPINYLG